MFCCRFSSRGTLEVLLQDAQVSESLNRSAGLSILIDVLSAMMCLRRAALSSAIKVIALTMLLILNTLIIRMTSVVQVYHGDIRSAAVVLADDFTAKVDLSRSAWVTLAAGPVQFMSPEALRVLIASTDKGYSCHYLKLTTPKPLGP